MKRNLIIIFAITFIIGIIILMNSVNLGSNAVDKLLLRRGGINDYPFFLEQCILNYKILGGILAILGGFGVILNTRVKS